MSCCTEQRSRLWPRPCRCGRTERESLLMSGSQEAPWSRSIGRSGAPLWNQKTDFKYWGEKTFHVRPLWFHLITFQVFTCQFQPESFYLLFRTALRRIWASGSRTLSHILPGLKIELLTFKGNKNHPTYTGTTFPSQKTAKQSQGESTWSRKGTLDVVPT